jgi:hypothetical protein
MSYLRVVLLGASICVFPGLAFAQSPELSMREFSSAQIKKGVRSLGFGGDGATWGNYALVWKDADSALVDFGDTHYTNGNNFDFVAVGMNSPPLWHHLAIYAVAMFQNANNVRFSAQSPGLGSSAVPLIGSGTDQGIFVKFAMPLGKGFSVGGLLNYEVSRLDASTVGSANETAWRPSGGFGITWEPDKRLLFGFRGLANNDLERRTDPAGLTQGIVSKTEFRLGGSVSPWDGALIDAGATRLASSNAQAGTHSIFFAPNIGFEQALLDKHLTLRGGVDETSPTAGLTLKFSRYKLDTGYVHDMAKKRIGDLFGTSSQSILFTFTVDYGSTH